MKKIFLVAFFAATLTSAYALDVSCFVMKSESVAANPNEILRVENYAQIYPVQWNAMLPIKEIPQMTSKKYLNYAVVKSTGFQDINYGYISDNNPETFLQFDKNPKSITIKIDKPVLQNSFHVSIDADIYDIAEVEVSDDGIQFQYILLSDIERVWFQYVRFSFVDTRKNGDKTAFAPTQIRDILFYENEERNYLIKSLTNEAIFIYTASNCQNETIAKALASAYQIGQKTKMGIDVNTKLVGVTMEKNDLYDNDQDGDGVSNDQDNCPLVVNRDQKDTDKDFVGDVCDIAPNNRNTLLGDSDKDTIDDERDNCPFTKNPDQKDSDANGKGDACSDDDQDGYIGIEDNCPTVGNSDQKDVNVNGIGDVCESDRDKDGYFDTVDTCPAIANPDQSDRDNDGIGDMCDNCNLYNPDQRDENNDGKGDVCAEWEAYQKSHDDDGDKVLNWEDNCPSVANPMVDFRTYDPTSIPEVDFIQPDKDLDRVGDACDNCVDIQNADQEDMNRNSIGDMCEDMDGDGRQSYQDNCPLDTNADQADKNNDGVGDVCDDTDGDNLRASIDNCPYQYNPDQMDSDKDGRGDKCDSTDGRFLESNKGIFIAIFALIGLGMLAGILILGKKLLPPSSNN